MSNSSSKRIEFEIEKAKLSDVNKINSLIGKYSKKGFMLYRTNIELEQRIRDYIVAKHKGEFAGCCALRIWNKNSAEIYALAVSEKFSGHGLGKTLINKSIEEAKKLGIKFIFTLTIRKEIFMKQGFEKINLSKLPRIVFTEKTVLAEKAFGLKLKD